MEDVTSLSPGHRSTLRLVEDRPGDTHVPRPAVLLVDDDPTLLAVGHAILVRQFEVLTASSCAEALDLLDLSHVAVLLTDLQMPGPDGIALIDTASTRRPDLICMLLTGSSDAGALATERRLAGLHKVLRKPVPPQELRQVVAHAVDVWVLQRRAGSLAGENARLAEALRRAIQSEDHPDSRSLRDGVAAYERRRIRETLAMLDGNKSAAARHLGLTYRGLLLKMQRHGMTDGRPRRPR